MIARLAWRVRGFAVDVHLSDGATTRVPKVPLGRVSYYYVVGVF
jgi:hypothetical protein